MTSHLGNFDLLKAERKSRGWTQAKVAEALGVDVATVRRWEAGLVMPHPYHRRKICALFAITPQQLGLLPDIDGQRKAPPTGAGSEPAAETFLLAEPVITEPLDTAESPLPHDGLLKPIKQPLSPLSPWHGGFVCIKSLSTFRPLHRFSRRSFFILSTILFAVLLIVVSLPVFPHLPLPGMTEQHASPYSPPSYTLAISTKDPSLENTAQHLQQAFKAVYSQLVNRFALDPAAAPRQVTLTFASDLSSPATTQATTITLSPHWMREHPTDVGLLTHELTLMLEQYPSGAPDWFGNGMADYARSVYGPANDDDWSLPDRVQPQENYTQGGTVTARFLLWLEYNTTPDIVDQLNYALQTKQSFSGTFYHLTNHTVDELWKQYKAQPDITPTPQQLYKTVTSRKPLYQSSLHVVAPQAHILNFAYAPGLYLSNFAVQADMTTLSGNGGGFIFRDNYRLRVSPDGSFDLVNQTDILAASSFSPAIKGGLDQTNQLTIIAHKHAIYLYINHQFIAQIEDSASSYGTVGVMAVNLGDPTDVRFEKIHVF